jgi:plasmid stabilization system protein ParE
MARVQKTHSARRDLAHIWAYIAYDSPRNADLFLEKIAQTLARLADFPGIGTRREELSAGLRAFQSATTSSSIDQRMTASSSPA